MKISDLQNQYSAFYNSYPLTKTAEKDVAVFGGIGKRAQVYVQGEESYRTFKRSVAKLRRSHPQYAATLEQILSNTRILRHRQKLSERRVFTVPGDTTFLDLAGKAPKVERWLRVVNEDLQSPFKSLEASQATYQQAFECLETRHKRAIETLQQANTSRVSQKKFDAAVQTMGAEQKQSPESEALKKRGAHLKRSELEVTEKQRELNCLLVKRTQAYRLATGPSQEMRSLEKLERIRVKIARFKAFWRGEFFLNHLQWSR